MSRVIHLMRKELIELRQDPRLFGIVILAPILQLTILGYAATTDVKDVPMVVVDADRSVASRELLSRFEASDNFSIVGVVGSTGDIDRWLEDGRAWMALSIPPGYGDRIERGETANIQVVADGSDSNSTNVALGYARVLIGAEVAHGRQRERIAHLCHRVERDNVVGILFRQQHRSLVILDRGNALRSTDSGVDGIRERHGEGLVRFKNRVAVYRHHDYSRRLKRTERQRARRGLVVRRRRGSAVSGGEIDADRKVAARSRRDRKENKLCSCVTFGEGYVVD